jgi:hypothetical protein
VLPDSAQPTFGAKRCGLLDLTLSIDGGATETVVEPPGLRQLMLITNIPNPYRH